MPRLWRRRWCHCPLVMFQYQNPTLIEDQYFRACCQLVDCPSLGYLGLGYPSPGYLGLGCPSPGYPSPGYES